MAKQRRLVKNVVVECGFVPFIDGKGQTVMSVYVKHTFVVPLGLITLILEIQTPVFLCFLKEETSAVHRKSLLVSNHSHELWGHVCYHLGLWTTYYVLGWIETIYSPTNIIVYLYNETYLAIIRVAILYISVHPVHINSIRSQVLHLWAQNQKITQAAWGSFSILWICLTNRTVIWFNINGHLLWFLLKNYVIISRGRVSENCFS